MSGVFGRISRRCRQFLYRESFRANVRRREGRNWASKYAAPAYITAAASIEAFVNESLLSQFAQQATSKSPIWKMTEKERRKLEFENTTTKILKLTRMASGKALDTNKRPYKDMLLLFTLRNALMHYKFGPEEEGVLHTVDELTKRGIAFPASIIPPIPWLDRVSTTEGIRWAYNSVVMLMFAQISVMPDGHFKTLMMNGVTTIGLDEWKKLVQPASV